MMIASLLFAVSLVMGQVAKPARLERLVAIVDAMPSFSLYDAVCTDAQSLVPSKSRTHFQLLLVSGGITEERIIRDCTAFAKCSTTDLSALAKELQERIKTTSQADTRLRRKVEALGFVGEDVADAVGEIGRDSAWKMLMITRFVFECPRDRTQPWKVVRDNLRLDLDSGFGNWLGPGPYPLSDFEEFVKKYKRRVTR